MNTIIMIMIIIIVVVVVVVVFVKKENTDRVSTWYLPKDRH